MKAHTMNLKVPMITAFSLVGGGGRRLLTVHSDGRVEGDVEDAPEAAAVFVREVQRLWGTPRTVQWGVQFSYGDKTDVENVRDLASAKRLIENQPLWWPGHWVPLGIVSRLAATEWAPFTPSTEGSET